MEDVGDVLAPRTTNLCWGIQNKIICQIFIGPSFCVNPRQKKIQDIYISRIIAILISSISLVTTVTSYWWSEKGCCWGDKVWKWGDNRLDLDHRHWNVSAYSLDLNLGEFSIIENEIDEWLLLAFFVLLKETSVFYASINSKFDSNQNQPKKT